MNFIKSLFQKSNLIRLGIALGTIAIVNRTQLRSVVKPKA